MRCLPSLIITVIIIQQQQLATAAKTTANTHSNSSNIRLVKYVLLFGMPL